MTAGSLSVWAEEAKSAPQLVQEAVQEAAECVEMGLPIPKVVSEIVMRWRGRMCQQDRFGK